MIYAYLVLLFLASACHHKCQSGNRLSRAVWHIAEAAGFVLAGMAAMSIGCVHVDRVQVGPDSFPWGRESKVTATSKPSDNSDLPGALITSQPSDIQTPEEILDELFGNLESYR